MRCRSCGAKNRPGALWCTLCFARFDAGASGGHAPAAASAEPSGPSAPADTPPPRGRADDDSDPFAWMPQALAGAGLADEPAAGEHGAEPGAGPGWPCPACERENPVGRDDCAGCGTPFAARLREAPPVTETRVTVAALLASVLVPGMGHVAVGQRATGIGRAGLALVWLLGGVALLVRGPSAAAAAAPLLIGALAIWALSILDLIALGNGGQPLLRGRLLLWLVVGVLGLTLLGGVAALGTVAGP